MRRDIWRVLPRLALAGSDMKKAHTVVLASVILGCLGFARGAAANKDEIPNDFKLTAEYYVPYEPIPENYPSPLKRWYPWRVTITADGKAAQETDMSVGTKKHIMKKVFVLTQQELKRLIDDIQSAKFYLLAEKYSYEVTDNPTLVLRLTMDRKFHEVTVYAPDKVKGREEVAAFLKIWNRVVTYVPPPNPGQSAE